MSYTSTLALSPTRLVWKMVNEMSILMSTGQVGNFIFLPVFFIAARGEPGNKASWVTVTKVCTSVRNLTWFPGRFFHVRG